MKYKKVIIFISFILLYSYLSAVTINEIKTAGDDYLWGEGYDRNPNRADKTALQHLISQISVQVKSNFISVIEENKDDITEYTERVVETYSNVMLDDAHYLQEEKDGVCHVLRYMKKDDLDKLFAQRVSMIHDYIESGISAEKDLRIGDALKYYYWALCLLKSHPDMNEIRGINDSMKGLLIIKLPEKIDQLFNSLEFKIRSSDYDKQNSHRKTLLEISYRGEPVSNLDYKYYTGNNWTPYLTSVNNGLGIVEYLGVPAKDMTDVKLRIEYVYESKSKMNIALNSVIANTNIPWFSNSQKKIDQLFIPKSPKKEKISTESVGVMLEEEESGQDSKCYKTVMDFVKAYDNKDPEKIMACLTTEGQKIFNKLMNYGNAEMIHEGKINLTCYKVNDSYLVRSIPFKFNFPYNNRKFIEDVVFILNEEAKITSINFALSDISINDIMDKSNEWGSVERKQQIIHFMESYKTAYCLENIDYIERIFSDEALIIVGQSLKSGKNIDSMYTSSLSNDEVKYIKMNKREYIERLKRIFGSSEAINIHFEEATVKRSEKDFTYGIQIAQYYYSSSYADFGYLFLMFDINDPKEPKIWVRSWQPEKNPDGTIIGIERFTF